VNKNKCQKIPHPHENFYKIDPKIQRLFLNALDTSFDNPDIRPSADTWCMALSDDPEIILNRKLPAPSGYKFNPSYSQ
jgi:DNA-binding helix-hairpin-helix protein with protein kinase domain